MIDRNPVTTSSSPIAIAAALAARSQAPICSTTA